MVMAFNPDDPHDGWAADRLGFTYRMIHIGPELVAGVLSDLAGRPAGLPLFADPVVSDPVLARSVRDLHRALLGGAPALRRDELLAAVVQSAVGRVAVRALPVAETAPVEGLADTRLVARRARELISAS